jgi:predicted transcriptional regulator of viral defense system
MEFGSLLDIVGSEPLFGTDILLAGDVNPADVRRQLSRWGKAGKVYQLRRGLYSLAPPYQKVILHPFLLANRLMPGSYISLQSALAFYGLIPEGVPVTTSVTTGRPTMLSNPIGQFDFRHIQPNWLRAYRQIDLGNGQKAFVATPEKALLDLAYLVPGGDTPEFLNGLRLQALDQLDLNMMQQLSLASNKPKLTRAFETIQLMAKEEQAGYENL